MNEDEIRNYLLNTINSTHFLVQDKIHRDDKKFNKRNDFYRIKKYLDNFIEKIKGNPDADIIDVYEALDMFLPGMFAYRSILDGNKSILPLSFNLLRFKYNI